MARVLNLPLSRAQYERIREGNRALTLKSTPHLRGLLFDQDDPKPYERVNIRLGVSGKPTQYILESLTDEGAEFALLLGKEITPIEGGVWHMLIQHALIDNVIGYIESAKGYAVYHEATHLKKASRQADELIRDYRRALAYSPYNRAGRLSELKENSGELHDLIAYWRSIKASIIEHYPECQYPDMSAEALMGVCLCRTSRALYGLSNKQNEEIRALMIIPQEAEKLLLQFCAPYAIADDHIKRVTDTFLLRLKEQRQETTLLTN